MQAGVKDRMKWKSASYRDRASWETFENRYWNWTPWGNLFPESKSACIY